jgi:site-specific recombinase XerC
MTLPETVVQGSIVPTSTAQSGPAWAFVLSMATPAARRTMQSSIVVAVDAMQPDYLPPAGAGRAGNLVARFAVAAALPWASLDPARLQTLRDALRRRGLAPATLNKVLAAVRGVVRQAWVAGDIDAERRERLLHQLQGVASSTIPAGSHLDERTAFALFMVCRDDGTALGRRDAAMLALMYGAGLRRAEVVGLRVDDLTPDGLRVRGKGNRQRVVPITNGTLSAVQDWMAARGNAPGYLLCRCSAGIDPTAGLTTQTVYAALRSMAERVGRATGRRVTVTPHDLRRTFVGRMLDAGADLATVQTIVGHANPATTARYDRRPQEARRRAMSMLSIPYR